MFKFFAVLFSIQTPLSIIYHSHCTNGGFYGSKAVELLDKFFARCILMWFVMYIVLNERSVFEIHKLIIAMSVLYIVVVYEMYIKHAAMYTPFKICTAMKLHLSMHIIMIFNGVNVVYQNL